MNILFNNDVVYEQQIGKFIFGGDYFKLKDIHHTIEDNKLRFAIAVDAFTKDIAYSFYLIKDGAADKKVFYQMTPEIIFDVAQTGKYRVQWYIIRIQ